MRHRRLRRQASRPGSTARRPHAPGVPRLRLSRHLDDRGRRDRLGARRRQSRPSARGRLGARRQRRVRWRRHRHPHRHHGDRPHALGHPRARQRGERPPALRHRRPRAHRGQRDRRELPVDARAPERHGRGLHQRDRRRGHRAPDRPPHGHRLAPGGRARRLQRARGPLRLRRDVSRRARDARRRAQGVPADRRTRRGRDVLRQRHPGLPQRDAPRAVHRERRDRRDHSRGHHVHPARRHRARARDRRDRLGPGDRREGRLRDLHAQGDPRAGRRTGRDDRRPHRARGRRRPRRRRRARRGDPARRRADHRRRLRHELPRGAHRPLRDRGVGAHPGGDGHRLGVPLSQPRGRAGRPRHRHHAVGRDGRHAGRHAHRPRARRDGAGADEHHGLAGHARRRRRALHARRPRGRRRGHQDLHLPGGGHDHARP